VAPDRGQVPAPVPRPTATRIVTVLALPADIGPVAVSRRSPDAGGYAERRYRRGRARWQARTRVLLAACFGPFVVLGLAGAILEPHLLTWAAGVVFGLGLGAWIVLRESPPAYVENWRTGAEGERRTAPTLRRLDPSRWVIAHDIQTAHGNYDHVLAGNAGVFLLDTKYPQGDAYFRGDDLWLRRRDDPDAHAPYPWPRGSALAGAARLSEELRERTGQPVWVHAVVVLWCPFEQSIHEGGRCVVLHGTKLVDWLDSRPDVLDQPRLDALIAGTTSLG